MSKILKHITAAGIVSLAITSLFVSCRINTPPIVEIEEGKEVSVVNGATAQFTAVVTDPDEGQEITYQWYVDGTAAVGATSTSFGYVTGPVDNPETYTVRVVAADERGGTGEDSATLTVNPAEYFPLDQTGTFEFSLDIGSSPRDVYFLFTNTTVLNQTTLPSVTQTAGSRSLSGTPHFQERQLAPGGTKPIAQRGSPEISAFNNGPHDFGPRISSRDLYGGEPEPPLFYQVGVDTAFFRAYNRSGYSTIEAVFGGSTSANGKTLNIWVADNCWETTGSSDHKVNADMVEILAQKFLAAGDNNDIYEWITGIFGDEWGPHNAGNLITPDDQITILLYDIDEDGMPGSGDRRIVGLFDSVHNFTRDHYSNSNELIMFSLDAVLFADDADNPDGTGTGIWEITDYWPSQVVSTLAHEFQHMIHFYQKNILRLSPGDYSDTWLNEMCSVMAEDLVADKMEVNGPRGYDSSDGSAGSPYITEGRLPLFNYYNDLFLIVWEGYLEDYSLVYSFGAYLGRNFGGAEFFRNVVQNSEGDYGAVEFALEQMDYNYTFWDVLRRWSVGVVYSDSTAAPADLKFNRGDWFTSSLNGMNFNLGSIDFFNYEYTHSNPAQQGPFFYTTSPVGGWTEGSSYVHYKTATSYYLAGEGLTGENSWDFSLPSGIRLTVVLK